MEQYKLTVGEGEAAVDYLLADVLFLDEKCFFTILNLKTFDVMFGEYLGETVEDKEEMLGIIHQDFLNGCRHITYVDGYMEDALYDTLDF